MRKAAIVSLVAACFATAAVFPEAGSARDAKAKTSISRGNDARGGGRTERRQVRNNNNNNNNRNTNVNRNVNRNSNRNVVAGNTVVVNQNVDRNYHHHGYYDDDYYDHWDDDDDGFFEVMGKAAAVTAGVAVTAAVVGEIFEDEPDDCQQSVSNGQTYLFCNGIWYQPVMAGSNVQYVVVEAP